MITIQIKEEYAEALEPLGQSVDEALRRLAVERANQHIAELQQKIKVWEERYKSSYDLFAYRTSTDEAFVAELNANPATQQWEADLLKWEFYATELNEWYKRLQNILTA